MTKILQILESKKIILFIIVLFLFLFYSKKIIKNFDGPLMGYGDTNNWEHTGYFLNQYLSFRPFPKIQFENNGTLYPHGSNHVYQSWSLEKDFFWLLFYNFFGNGPWLKYYILLTILLTYCFCYLLLRKQFSYIKTNILSILLTFFNFYSILKYPYHLVYTNIHWIVISFVLDYLVLYYYFNHNKLNFKLIHLRILITILSLGLELGYIVGFGLTLFLFTYSYLLINLIRDKKILVINEFKMYIFENKKFVSILTIFSFLIFLIYLSFLWEILKTVYKFNIPESSEAYWWSNPFRIFLPYFPITIKSNMLLETIFMDSPDSVGSGSIGWFLLITGFLGLIHSRKQFKVYLPFLSFLILLLLYHPLYFPILKIFPWFKYMRVSGRGTIVLPILFSLFIAGIDFKKFQRKYLNLFISTFIILGIFELNHAYKLRLNIESIFPNEFYSLMDKIKTTKGEAILDWPFCIYGANIESTLCPFYPQTIGTYSFSRFHGKKVIGQYYGRMLNSQADFFTYYGFQDLFLYDSHSNIMFPSQKRCFNEKEWEKFTTFYNQYDFSGINLYTDIIGKECELEFYARFGPALEKILIPYSGHLAFIPKNK